jgi:hypothetical protein
MASYVAEFVILNEIDDFRDICEGSTDDTFVILCAVASLIYICISLFLTIFSIFVP